MCHPHITYGSSSQSKKFLQNEKSIQTIINVFIISVYYMQNTQPKYKLKVVMIIFGQSWKTVQKTANKS